MDTLELPRVAPGRVTWYRVDDPRPRRSPRDRPPAVIRASVGLLGVGAVLAAIALLLSDRAPGLLEMAFGDRARQLWERIDAAERVGLRPDADVPPTDFLAHVAIWAVVATLFGLAVWSWRGLVGSAVVLGGASLLVELAQGRYSTARTVQADDAVANVIGVAMGVVAAAACYLAWSLAAGVVRAARRPRAASSRT